MEDSIPAGNEKNGVEERGGFLPTMQILVTWRRFIVINVMILTALAVIVSFILPKWYRASTSIMAPKDQSFLNFLGQSNSVLKGLGSLSKIGGNQNTGPYNYFALLKSRRAMDSVVNKFNLASVYGVNDSSREKTIKELRDNVAFESQEDDYITIEVLDQDPQRSAEIANYFVDLLNTISIELGTKEAKNNRIFLEERVATSKDSLRKTEESLKKFQENNGIIITPEQSSSLSAIAELYAARAKKDLEVSILQQHVTEGSEVLQQLRLELRELDKKLATIPQAGIQSFRLYREVMTQQKILEFLIPLYEQAKINEQKSVPVLLVLDKAITPEKKAKPQRVLIVTSVFFLSAFLGILVVLIFEGSLRRKSTTAIERNLQGITQRVIRLYRISSRLDA
jgi:tyrosine-protein kinase Etk/Wzc